MKHTPKPWTIKVFDEAQTVVLGLDGTRRPLVAICTGDNRAANAALISQAPELVEAIAEYRQWFDTCTKTLAPNWEERAGDASVRLDKALARAKGQL